MLKKLAAVWILVSAAFALAQVKPAFQAFGADYLKLGEASRGYHPFEVKVNFAPWAFVARGSVKAPQGDPDLLFNSMDNDQLYIMVAYSPSPVAGSDGLEYQAGIYDITLFYSDGEDEFQASVKDLNIALLPPIAGDSWATGSLQEAQGKRGAPGSVFKNKEFANAIFQASAQPLSKAQAKAAVKAAEERKKQAVKARRDSIAAAQKAAEKRRQDSIASVAERRRQAEAAQQEQMRQQQLRQQQQQYRQQQQYPQQQQYQQQQQYPQQQQYRQQQQYPQQQQYQQQQYPQQQQYRQQQQQYPQQQQYRQQQQYPQQQQYQQQQQYPQQQQYRQQQQYPQQQQYQQQPVRQNAAPAVSSDPCDQPGMTPLQKKKCKMSQ